MFPGRQARTYERHLDAAVGLEEEIAGHRADEIRAGAKPGLVVQLVEQGERLLDPICVSVKETKRGLYSAGVFSFSSEVRFILVIEFLLLGAR